jgi:hypothetical protein
MTSSDIKRIWIKQSDIKKILEEYFKVPEGAVSDFRPGNFEHMFEYTVSCDKSP